LVLKPNTPYPSVWQGNVVAVLKFMTTAAAAAAYLTAKRAHRILFASVTYYI